MAADEPVPRRRLAVIGTVRFRVTALATVVVLVVLVVAGVAVTRAQERTLRANLDEQLEQVAGELEATVVDGRTPSAVTGFGDDDAAFQVVDGDGAVLTGPRNAAAAGPLAPPPAQDVAVVVRDGLPHDDARFLVRSERVVTPDGPVVIHVAAALDDVDESVDALAGALWAAVPIVVAVLAVSLWFVVGRTLRPVEAMRAEVAAIGGADLHRRVADPGGDDEVARLARTMNGMLDRIEDAARRQQRFVADASHELRSPLTRIRSELEVDLAHPATADATRTGRSVLDETLGLQRLVDDLLHLARADAGALSRPPKDVALDALVAAAADDLRSAGRVAVDDDAVDAVVVPGHRDHLRRLVVNLVDNAGRHAESRVGLELRRVDGNAVLTVTDDGPGIPVADRERVFERFTRLDEARASATGGAGLGLAIAREIAEAHGGNVAVVDANGPGARLEVTLPAII